MTFSRNCKHKATQNKLLVSQAFICENPYGDVVIYLFNFLFQGAIKHVYNTPVYMPANTQIR